MSLLRLPRVMELTGRSRTRIYVDIANGLMVQLVRLGPRASGIPSGELDAILAAKTGGASDEQIRALVRSLHERRADAAAKALAGV